MPLPIYSQGPERYRGGAHCPEHHDGVRTGFPDWCCCCDPCLYVRPSENGVLADLASHSCRCVPQLICVLFTPDDGSDPCAKPIQTARFPDFTVSATPGTITWDFGSPIDVQITITESMWRFYSLTHSVDESYPIDHINTTCLEVPAVTISGAVVGGVTGTITFSTYSASKLPFISRQATAESEAAVDVPEGFECSCTTAAVRLCVNGRRHAGGPIEQVEFYWEEGASTPRWKYLPPNGDPTYDRELIYLRGDEAGNCYLELDFEQSSAFTNDWAEPPTSDGDTAKMIAIPTCTCELFVQSTRDDGATGDDIRFVTITGGRCAEYRYACGSCRCVPTYLCVFGEIDGELIQSRATWFVEELDETGLLNFGWRLDDFPEIMLKLIESEDAIDTSDRVKQCALYARQNEGEQLALTNPSNIISCGFQLTAQMEKWDEENQRVNWLWVSASICGSCNASTCGDCPDRCGSNPLVLYVDLHGIDNGPDDPEDPYFGVQTFCDTTVTVYYFEQWSTTSRGEMVCGYVGYSDPITCCDNVYRVKVIMYTQGGEDFRVSREYLSGPVFDDYGPTGGNNGSTAHWPACESSSDPNSLAGTVSSLVCDPYFKEINIADVTLYCLWGCSQTVDEYEATVYE